MGAPFEVTIPIRAASLLDAEVPERPTSGIPQIDARVKRTAMQGRQH